MQIINPITIDHDAMDPDLDEMNKQLLWELESFKELQNFDGSKSEFEDDQSFMIDDPDASQDKELSYKRQFLKAMKLSKNLKKQLDDYKKMGRIVQYIAGKQYGNEAVPEELTDDIKLIISDLKEHIDIQESEELKMIKHNFSKIIGKIDKEHSKEIEEILQNLISSKSSKKDALKDFTDKIISTVEDIEERKDEQ